MPTAASVQAASPPAGVIQVNIQQLIDRDGMKLMRQSGREWSGPCPWCGGRDRLRVWPDEANGGSFWCRQCGRGGDAIRYHMLRAGVGYLQACSDLGVEPKFRPSTSSRSGPRVSVMPCLVWRQKSRKIIEHCAKVLFTDRGESVRAFLADRGITEKTMQRARLGLNTKDRHWNRIEFGLSDDVDKKCVWLPAGLVIPTFHEGEPARIRVRRFSGDPRYVVMTGSGGQLMRYGHNVAVLVVESELDAILCSQAAGDLVAVIALGSASAKPDAETDRELKQCQRILLALDYDQAGAAQTKWWTRTYGEKVKRWPVPHGKDPGELKSLGVDARSWILAGIETGQYFEPSSRSCKNDLIW